MEKSALRDQTGDFDGNFQRRRCLLAADLGLRAAARLPDLHRDPWDLVAQARLGGLTLVTADARLAAYDVPTLW